MVEDNEVKRPEIKVQTSMGEVVLTDPPASLAMEYLERGIAMSKLSDKDKNAPKIIDEYQKWVRQKINSLILRTPACLDKKRPEDWPASVYKAVVKEFVKCMGLFADDKLEKK